MQTQIQTQTNTGALVAGALVLPQNFPIALSPDQETSLKARAESFKFVELKNHDVAQLGLEAELALNRTLDGFLARIDQQSSPQLFQLMAALNDSVAQENLPEVAERILNAKPPLWARLIGVLNPKMLRKASARAFEETARLASGKSKKLSDVIGAMELRLKTEMSRLNDELHNMDTVKAEYRKSFIQFAEETVYLNTVLAKARAEVAAMEPELAKDAQLRAEAMDKLQALESRALAVEHTLTKLPADQLVIRQLQNAGLATLQELATTMSSRFASIKMTLLTIQGARMVQDVQRLGQQGADLDANLSQVRSLLMQDVVSTAAHAPGNNREAQAKQLQAVVADTAALVTLAETARDANKQKFQQARVVMAQARQDMLALGKTLNPGATMPSRSY